MTQTKSTLFPVGRVLTSDEWALLRQWRKDFPEKKWALGDVGADGRRFWAYAKRSKNGEKWVAADRFSFCTEGRIRTLERGREKKRASDKRYREKRKEFFVDYGKKYYAENKHTIVKRANDYYHSNKARVSEQAKQHYLENREEIRALQKARLKSRPQEKKDAEREKRKEYYRRNAEAIKAKVRRWQKENPEKMKIWYKNRRASDPAFVLMLRCRSRLGNVLRRKGVRKASPTAVMLGCGWTELKNHIEGLFLPGMSWDNAGEWHLDHIVPCASAKTEEELLALFHHKNLQPMWAEDNLRKGALIPPMIPDR